MISRQAPYTETEFYTLMAAKFTDSMSLQSAWAEYIVACNASLPAILYKMKELTYLRSKFYMNNKWNEMKLAGCVYDPYHHNWDVNSVWVLAHIHRGNNFVVMSDLTDNYAKRSGNRNQYSAFAKEIATTLKAGYEVSSVTYTNDRYITYLSPTQSKSQALSVTVDSCRVSDEDCEAAFVRFNESKLRYIVGLKIAPELMIKTQAESVKKTKTIAANDAAICSKASVSLSETSSSSSTEYKEKAIIYISLLFPHLKDSGHAKVQQTISTELEINSGTRLRS